jgi:hypothetical protein
VAALLRLACQCLGEQNYPRFQDGFRVGQGPVRSSDDGRTVRADVDSNTTLTGPGPRLLPPGRGSSEGRGLFRVVPSPNPEELNHNSILAGHGFSPWAERACVLPLLRLKRTSIVLIDSDHDIRRMGWRADLMAGPGPGGRCCQSVAKKKEKRFQSPNRIMQVLD